MHWVLDPSKPAFSYRALAESNPWCGCYSIIDYNVRPPVMQEYRCSEHPLKESNASPR